MAKWVNRLDLRDLWEKRSKGEINIQGLGKEMARRIKKLSCFKEYEEELEEIAIDFEFVEENIKAFDEILSRLYDWADSPLYTPKGQMQRKMCWVSTIF